MAMLEGIASHPPHCDEKRLSQYDSVEHPHLLSISKPPASESYYITRACTIHGGTVAVAVVVLEYARTFLAALPLAIYLGHP